MRSFLIGVLVLMALWFLLVDDRIPGLLTVGAALTLLLIAWNIARF